MNSPTLRDMIGQTYTYRPDLPPYRPEDDTEPGRIIVGNGMDVQIVEAFDDWNDVPGLIVFYVFVPETGEYTHLSDRELGGIVPAT